MIDELIEISERMTALLKELKQATEEQAAKYVVEKHGPYNHYALTDKIKLIHYGTKHKIERYIRTRKLTVYWRPVAKAVIELR